MSELLERMWSWKLMTVCSPDLLIKSRDFMICKGSSPYCRLIQYDHFRTLWRVFWAILTPSFISQTVRRWSCGFGTWSRPVRSHCQSGCALFLKFSKFLPQSVRDTRLRLCSYKCCCGCPEDSRSVSFACRFFKKSSKPSIFRCFPFRLTLSCHDVHIWWWISRAVWDPKVVVYMGQALLSQRTDSPPLSHLIAFC